MILLKNIPLMGKGYNGLKSVTEVARILYGAPESEREEKNDLVARLGKKHQVGYLNDFLGFAFELSRCKDSRLLPRQYDLVIYDTLLYGEEWLPETRAENFQYTITPFFAKKDVPIIILADEAIKEKIIDWALSRQSHYIAQPYSISEVAKMVNSLLPKRPRKLSR